MMKSKDGHDNEMDDSQSAERIQDHAAIIACFAKRRN